METCLSSDNSQDVPRNVIQSSAYSLNCMIQKGLGISINRAIIEYPMEQVMKIRSNVLKRAKKRQILSNNVTMLFLSVISALVIVAELPTR